jgi:hypothetical protein
MRQIVMAVSALRLSIDSKKENAFSVDPCDVTWAMLRCYEQELAAV